MVKKACISILSILTLVILSGCIDKYPDRFKNRVESMIIDIQEDVTEEAFCTRWSENYNETDEGTEDYISCKDHYHYLINLNIPKSSDNKYPIYYTETDEYMKNGVTPYYYKHDNVEYLIGMTDFDQFLKIE